MNNITRYRYNVVQDFFITFCFEAFPHTPRHLLDDSWLPTAATTKRGMCLMFFFAIGGAGWTDFDKASVPASKGGASYSKRPRQELAAR